MNRLPLPGPTPYPEVLMNDSHGGHLTHGHGAHGPIVHAPAADAPGLYQQAFLAAQPVPGGRVVAGWLKDPETSSSVR